MRKLKTIIIGLAVLVIVAIGYLKYFNLRINDIGLSTLSWVKKMRGKAVDLSTIASHESPVVDHQIWTDLLKEYVDEQGGVDYKGFQKDTLRLSEYLKTLSNHPPGSNWTEAAKLAYWINAYNAFTIQLILDHYPLKSIKDIGGGGLAMINSPWDIKFFKIGDIPFDLNTIEHEIIRKEFHEPRIHFAVNCASISCPKLRNEAYTAEHLDAQLKDQTINFLNNPQKNRISSGETKLSKLFSWFQSDFTKEGDLLSFIAKYQPELNPENKVEYLDYDWGLNQKSN